MRNSLYNRAVSRSDLSQWLVHLVRDVSVIAPMQLGGPSDVMRSIFSEGLIRPSLQNSVTKYCVDGATCFYDAPPSVWPEIASTNPSQRKPIGLIVHRKSLWHLGGRPVIYTEHVDPSIWPPSERYRIVETNPARPTYPLDRMHEREWRFRCGLRLHQPQIPYIWWWPIVPNSEWANYLFNTSPNLSAIYVMDQGKTIERATRNIG
jgi:hypothetical protein